MAMRRVFYSYHCSIDGKMYNTDQEGGAYRNDAQYLTVSSGVSRPLQCAFPWCYGFQRSVDWWSLRIKLENVVRIILERVR